MYTYHIQGQGGHVLTYRVAGERQALHPGQFRNLNLIQDGGSPPIFYNRNALRGEAHALRALRKTKRVKTFFTLMAGFIEVDTRGP